MCDGIIADDEGYYSICVDKRQPDPNKRPGHFKPAFPIDLDRNAWVEMSVLSPMVCRPCAEEIKRLMYLIINNKELRYGSMD